MKAKEFFSFPSQGVMERRGSRTWPEWVSSSRTPHKGVPGSSSRSYGYNREMVVVVVVGGGA
jgi:hypothetical protein